MSRILPRRLLAALLCLCFAPLAVHADQLVLKNGDVITGKISRVDEKSVTIKPSYSQKFAVKRNAIESIETDSALEVELLTGEKIRARFAGIDEGLQVLVIEEQASTLDIESMRQAAVPPRWYERESRAEAMMTVNEGNTTSRNAVFNIDTRLRLGDHRQYAQFAFRRDENEDLVTKKQSRASYEYDWLFRRSWYLAATADYERDPIRDLNHRFTFGALMGHDLINTGHNFLTVKAGAGYTDQKLANDPTSGLVGLWELEYRHQFSGSRLELVHDHNLAYQDYGVNNTIVRSNTGLRVDILWDLYATASYRFNYESDPAPGKFGKDSTLAFGLGAKF